MTAENRRVIVTGASRGIGAAVAKVLGGAGYQVAINYARSEDKARAVQNDIVEAGGQALLLPFNIADRAAAREAMEQYLAQEGVPYGVVCNAGIAMDSPFPALEDEMWDQVINTNLGGLYNVLKPVTMAMARARSGRIVTMSSISGVVGNRGQVNYAASKAGIIGASKSLALELAKRGITVNVVAPGLIETDMVEGLPKEEILRMIPMRRYGTPKEVAAVVRFLMSPEAGYITGQVINVNGGMA